MHPTDNMFNIQHSSVTELLVLLLVLEETGLSICIIGFQMTFLRWMYTPRPGIPSGTLYCTILLQETFSSDSLVSDEELQVSELRSGFFLLRDHFTTGVFMVNRRIHM